MVEKLFTARREYLRACGEYHQRRVEFKQRVPASAKKIHYAVAASLIVIIVAIGFGIVSGITDNSENAIFSVLIVIAALVFLFILKVVISPLEQTRYTGKRPLPDDYIDEAYELTLRDTRDLMMDLIEDCQNGKISLFEFSEILNVPLFRKSDDPLTVNIADTIQIFELEDVDSPIDENYTSLLYKELEFYRFCLADDRIAIEIRKGRRLRDGFFYSLFTVCILLFTYLFLKDLLPYVWFVSGVISYIILQKQTGKNSLAPFNCYSEMKELIHKKKFVRNRFNPEISKRPNILVQLTGIFLLCLILSITWPLLAPFFIVKPLREKQLFFVNN